MTYIFKLTSRRSGNPECKNDRLNIFCETNITALFIQKNSSFTFMCLQTSLDQYGGDSDDDSAGQCSLYVYMSMGLTWVCLLLNCLSHITFTPKQPALCSQVQSWSQSGLSMQVTGHGRITATFTDNESLLFKTNCSTPAAVTDQGPWISFDMFNWEKRPKIKTRKISHIATHEFGIIAIHMLCGRQRNMTVLFMFYPTNYKQCKLYISADHFS